VRAYATNSAGTAYGDEASFTTAGTTSYVYTVVQYTIDQADGTTIILRSRGTGQGTEDGYFDIYIEDGLGGVESFQGDPVWYHFDGMTAEEALSHTVTEDEVRGHFASADEAYYLDIDGGSDMGGVTYQINTSSFGNSALGTAGISIASLSPQGTTPIRVDTEEGGDIETGTEDQWDDVYENLNGALFWNGSQWVTNDTFAHAYFTDLGTGERIKEHNVTVIGTATGTEAFYETTITRSTFTYTVEKATDGSGIKDLGASYPTEFDLEFTDTDGNIQELQFLPAIVSETEE